MTRTVFTIIGSFLALLIQLVGGVAVHAQHLPNPFPSGSVITLPPLANGLQIVLRENHAQPIVAMEVVIRSGAAAEAGMPGVAHFLEHVSFERTEHFPARFAPQFSLESVGGLSNAVTRRDLIRYNGVVASTQVSVLVKMLADIVLHPLLSDESCAAQRPVIAAEYEHQMYDPVTAMVNTAYQCTFPDHPYGVAPVGTMQDIMQVTPAMVRDFHKHWFTPSNITIVLVGDITAARAQAAVQAAFGDALTSVTPTPFTTDYHFTGNAVNEHLTWHIPSTYQLIVFPAPSAAHFSQFVAAQLLTAYLITSNHALLPSYWAQQGIHVGQLGQEYVGVRYPGRMLIWAQTPPADAEALFKSTFVAMDMLGKTGIGAQELSQAKATLTQQYLLGNMSYSDQAATLAYYVGLGDVKQASDYLAAVQAVTADDVRAVMPKSYLARITLGE